MARETLDESIEPAGDTDRAAGRIPRKRSAKVKASLEYALLGLIAERRMVSGYDLTRLFDLSMAHYWHAHHGQIYPTLERMRQRKWIRRRDVIQHGRPNKRLYSITPEGINRLMEWLRSPFEGLQMKHAPLLRCRFLGHLGAEGARQKFLEERAAWKRYLDTFLSIEQRFFAKGAGYHDLNMMFTYFTLHRGITMMEENIEWCDWALEQLAHNAGLFEKRSAQSTRPSRARRSSTG
jgi:DNA-binding PadR family transcriptional regulator